MGERSCVNVFGLIVERSLLRASMDISAHSFSLAVRPVMAIWVTSSRMRLQTLFHRSIRLADLGGIFLMLVVSRCRGQAATPLVS
jgi:hypothetical protein